MIPNMDRTGQNLKIKYEILGRIFHYSGKVLLEDANFLKLQDIKEGILELNKSRILEIKEV